VNEPSMTIVKNSEKAHERGREGEGKRGGEEHKDGQRETEEE
jgi:hypothetical protein